MRIHGHKLKNPISNEMGFCYAFFKYLTGMLHLEEAEIILDFLYNT